MPQTLQTLATFSNSNWRLKGSVEPQNPPKTPRKQNQMTFDLPCPNVRALEQATAITKDMRCCYSTFQIEEIRPLVAVSAETCCYIL